MLELPLASEFQKPRQGTPCSGLRPLEGFSLSQERLSILARRLAG